MITHTEENYLKAIFKIAEREKNAASTNSIAAVLNTSAASVSDMLKRLSEKELINYKKYKGVTLTSQGSKIATNLIRKHRLWEVFLVKKLKFSWDQVHDIAEQLEHIQSPELVNRLDNYLDKPKFDPHGDPIPNSEGKFTIRNQNPLSDLTIGERAVVIGVKEHDTEFLQYLNSIGVKLGTEIEIQNIVKYDRSMKVKLDGGNQTVLTDQVSSNLLVKRAL
ncbi:MAG: metal-dependent transcriptional regulator [Saprospiraceae bacterium]|nr:metal-dependent transcriptional regulator [Saprospiraceae bacterium]